MNIVRSSPWLAGISRFKITPPLDVELAGLGYYLKRTGLSIRDDLTATALVIQNAAGECAVIVTLDIMYASEAFAGKIRNKVARSVGIPQKAICINCSHSHNAPTAAFVRGVGEMDSDYIDYVVDQTVNSIISAWRSREVATLHVGKNEVENVTFNRTRVGGPVDTSLNVLRVDAKNNAPMAILLNFHSHLTAHLETDLRAISRDWPGEVIDQLEVQYPGVVAMYLQGTCGDVMLRPEFNSTERRFEPAQIITKAVTAALNASRPIFGETILTVANRVKLPTRRWTSEEISIFREEGLYRIKTGDTHDWLNGIAKSIVTYPERLPNRYGGSIDLAVNAVSRFAVEWSEETLFDIASRPEHIETEIQALRIGDICIIANSAELFTSLAMEVRNSFKKHDLFMASYSNGNIGYLPDSHDIQRKSYAAIQSPKFTGQFPFTSESGKQLVTSMFDSLDLACREL